MGLQSPKASMGCLCPWLRTPGCSWLNIPPREVTSKGSHLHLSPIQEIAEPLFDLKVGMEQLAKNHTFKCILATLLAMGNFLNGSQVRNGVLGDAAWVLHGEDQPWHMCTQDHKNLGRWCGCW